MTNVVIGASGQLASAFASVINPNQQTAFLGRPHFDLRKHDQIYDKLASIAPKLIINAAAYTAVDKAETDQQAAEAINSEAVDKLAAYAFKHDALLVHFSTDYVFNGESNDAYSEDATPNPINFYGKTKRDGELAIEMSRCRYAIFRCSWVCGEVGSNFVRTILHLASERSELKVVDDQIGSPTSAKFIASSTLCFLEEYALAPLGDRSHWHGIYHLTSNGQTSWHGFAKYIVSTAISMGFKSCCKPENIRPISTEEFGALAPRPKNSRLDCSKLFSKNKVTADNWQLQMLPVIKRALEELNNEA